MEKFIIKAVAAHGNKYDYSRVIYKGNQYNVTIVCPMHGPFEQSPKNHTNKKCGCPKCSYVVPRNKPVGLENFIVLSSAKHLDKYDYSRVIYTDNKADVIIGCPKHGYFEQRVVHHMRGHGCPKCKRSKGEEAVATVLNKLNLSFVAEKTFNDCRGVKGRMLRFDFYLQDLNLVIEYDGKFHYHPYKKGELDQLNNVKENDALKNKYCTEKGINLFRIHYNDLNKVETILTKKLTQYHGTAHVDC